MVNRTKCKSALFLCGFIVCVHVFLMMSLRGESIELDGMRIRITVDGGERLSRDVLHHRALQEQPGYENVNADDGTRGTNFDPDTDVYENCRAGHISGLTPFCDRKGCLDRLSPSVTGDNIMDVGVIPTEATEKLAYVRGLIDKVHIPLVRLLSLYQWRHGIYGTVAETGVYEGKFTAILSFNTLFEAGENLYAIDFFISETIRDHLETFSENMADMGLVDVMGDPQADAKRKILIHSGDLFDIDRDFLRTLGLHQFRLFSIGSELDGVTILSSLQLAACVIQDGGIIVVDGISESESPAKYALQTFFSDNGYVAISPLLAAKNKLYLITSNWKDKVGENILQHDNLFSPNLLSERTDSEYGIEFSYLVMEE